MDETIDYSQQLGLLEQQEPPAEQQSSAEQHGSSSTQQRAVAEQHDELFSKLKFSVRPDAPSTQHGDPSKQQEGVASQHEALSSQQAAAFGFESSLDAKQHDVSFDTGFDDFEQQPVGLLSIGVVDLVYPIVRVAVAKIALMMIRDNMIGPLVLEILAQNCVAAKT